MERFVKLTALAVRHKTTVVETVVIERAKGFAMSPDHVIIVVGFVTAVFTVLATLRPVPRKNPFWV
jgi:ABC-type proline/glycine betaine transport system permease subunit